MPERRSERYEHPNLLISNALNYYCLQAVGDGILSINNDNSFKSGVIYHLSNQKFELEQLPNKDQFLGSLRTVEQIAEAQYISRLLQKNARNLGRATNLSANEISYAPQALLFASYQKMLSNLSRLAEGTMTYGLEAGINRTQPRNAIASGEMIKPAIRSIVNNIRNRLPNHFFQSIIDLGAGDAHFAKGISSVYPNAKLIVSDKDRATMDSAKLNLGTIKHSWIPADISCVSDIQWLVKQSEGNILVHIGYITHESEEIRTKALNALHTAMPDNAVLALSEYYWQEDVTPEVPLWFQTIHVMTQSLVGREEYRSQVGEGFSEIPESEIVHQKRLDGRIMNSTTFWKKR